MVLILEKIKQRAYLKEQGIGQKFFVDVKY